MNNTFISIRWMQHFKAYLSVLPLYSLDKLSPSNGRLGDLAKFVTTTKMTQDLYKLDCTLKYFKNEKYQYARRLSYILNRDTHAFSDAQIENIIRFIAFLDNHQLIMLSNLHVTKP